MNTTIDISNVILRTERLILRPWTVQDLDDFYAYACVDGVGQMAGWSPHKDKEESLRILNSFIAGKHALAAEYQGRVIGCLDFKPYEEADYPELADQKCCEIGYVLAKDLWGKGLMPEAVQEGIRYLFEETDTEVILCGHFLSNRQSARVQEKCGFHHYAYGIYHTLFGTTEENEMNILRKEERQ